MTIDLDTFLVTLYVIVDDLYRAYIAAQRSHRPGKKGDISDSEVITLVILEQAYGQSETAFLDFVRTYWSVYFPYLPDQSAFNRRTRDLMGVLMYLIPIVASKLGAQTAVYEAMDIIPVPLMSRCRGLKQRLFGGQAALGKGGSDKEWYYGCKLLFSVTDDGAVTGFTVGPAATEDRWMAEHFLCWRADPSAAPWTPRDVPPSHNRRPRGPTGCMWGRNSAGTANAHRYIADRGFTGYVWGQHWLWDYQALVMTRDDYPPQIKAVTQREHCSWRQVIETINDHLTEVLHLKLPGARSIWGLLTRLAAKLLAINLGLMLNRMWGRADFAFATLFSF
jgi:hypothetical protein